MGTTTTQQRLAPGARIGDYIIDRDDGDGYEATHVLLPRRVSLTIMHPTFVGLRPVAVRMMREACILEAMRHPGVPRVYEVGVLADQRTQQPWVASELVEGESIAETIALGGYIPVVELLAVLRDVGEVLAYAHARNVAHRGVRPEAIIRGDGSRGFPVCLVQWGDARAPDVSEDMDRTCADDVFALGLVADLVLASRGGLPPKVNALVDSMLAPNPMSRPSAADVVARATEILDALESPTTPTMPYRARSITTPPATSKPRLRWTPANGITQLVGDAPASRAMPPPIPESARRGGRR